MDQLFYDTVAANPVIAAIKDPEGLEQCLAEEDIQVVLILFGDICNISEITEQVKAVGKIALVHVDLITGLSNKEVAVDFIRRNTSADGIVSTRQSFIRRARDLHMYTILRVFVIDSIALSSLEKLDCVKPDFIEILPGVMPKTIRKVCAITSIPVLAGGLIADKEDVMNALEAGATAISTTNQQVWQM
ncbi:glycerol-3-phosphate responsive antiterminator [Oscillospiraceae bacterium LTW-04]|nr:glycerol-3-phosphate responsive antiterminator [Oscillospiraceae bacterium MB24-C1]